MTKDERAEYQREWYYRNKEKRQEENRESYHRNKEKYKDQKKNNNKLYYLRKKGIILKQQENKEVINKKRFLNIHEVLDILRKDMKHKLWNKPVRRWTDEDWYKFSLI